MPRLRRSTVLLLAGAGAIAATLVTALVLVQRVQTDPLQVGATQVARLTPDPAFEIPSSLYRGITGNVKAYTAFEGFRVVSYPSFRAGEEAARCMTVYQPDLLDDSDDGFSYDGQFLLPSCGAGLFPATFTILLAEDTPERGPTDLPADTALQFVYDEDLDEVVVFEADPVPPLRRRTAVATPPSPVIPPHMTMPRPEGRGIVETRQRVTRRWSPRNCTDPWGSICASSTRSSSTVAASCRGKTRAPSSRRRCRRARARRRPTARTATRASPLRRCAPRPAGRRGTAR